jgi:hypothetical protein
MSLSFPKAGDPDAVVGQTPWSARVPLDQGVRPTTTSDRSAPAKLSDIGMPSCAQVTNLPHTFPSREREEAC